jgi:hypothetical protein
MISDISPTRGKYVAPFRPRTGASTKSNRHEEPVQTLDVLCPWRSGWRGQGSGQPSSCTMAYRTVPSTSGAPAPFAKPSCRRLIRYQNDRQDTLSQCRLPMCGLLARIDGEPDRVRVENAF